MDGVFWILLHFYRTFRFRITIYQIKSAKMTISCTKPKILTNNQYGYPNTLTFSINHTYLSDFRSTCVTPLYMTLWDVPKRFYRKFIIWYQYWKFNKTAKNIHIHGLIASKNRLNFSCQTTTSKNPIWKSKYILIFYLCLFMWQKNPSFPH